MADSLIRIGKVSSVDYKNGMISVTYPDMDDSTTDEFPCFSFTDEYKMPAIGAEVLVLHLSNGTSAAVVMGRYWNEANKPPVSGANMYRKELAQKFGDAYIQANGAAVKIHGASLTLSDSGGAVTVAQIRDLISRVSELGKYH